MNPVSNPAKSPRKTTHFGPREQDVLDLLTQGLLKKEIADRLTISEDTVRTHCQHIYDKLHVNCREHAVAKVVTLDMLPRRRSRAAGTEITRPTSPAGHSATKPM